MSAIRGVHDTHIWIHVKTANVGSNYWLKRSEYACSQCGTQFTHRYDLVPNIVTAMRQQGIPEMCKMSYKDR